MDVIDASDYDFLLNQWTPDAGGSEDTDAESSTRAEPLTPSRLLRPGSEAVRQPASPDRLE